MLLQELRHFRRRQLVQRHEQVGVHVGDAVAAAQMPADMDQYLRRHFRIGLGPVGGALSTIACVMQIGRASCRERV